MTTLHPVYVYYDANGNVSEWVVSDDDGFSPSERPGLVRVSCLRSDYNALPQDLNIAGMAVPHALNKLCVSALIAVDATLGAKLQANIAAVDAQLAIIAAQPPPIIAIDSL